MSAAPVVAAGSVKFGNDLPISIIAGPCALESRAHALEVASALKEIAAASAQAWSTRRPSTRPTAPAYRRPGASDWRRRCRSLPKFVPRSACQCSPMSTRPRNAPRWRRPSMCCRFRRSCAGRPICCWRRPRPARSSTSRRASFWRPGTWPMSLPRSPAPATRTCWSPSAARHSATTRWCRTCGRCRFWRVPPARP